MRRIEQLLDEYGQSHQNDLNKRIHWICVPLIMFSLLGLLLSIPFPVEKGLFSNWTVVVLALALLYYLSLSFSMFIGFVVAGGLMLLGNWWLYEWTGQSSSMMVAISFMIFVLAWIGQFYGHKVEGKKPSFFKDVQFLLIGPAWLLHFLYRKWGISY
jgi:uncharacterized membrane protein YGL010W